MKRILFVDDEPILLSGMERMLHGMRHEWEMHFAVGGDQALEVLSRLPLDVVVADMRMPGMDGVQLLNKVRELYPRAIRIILCGQPDEKSYMRNADATHLFLPKPCDLDTLRSAVTRACGLQEQVHQTELTELVSRITRLPSLPSLYLELNAEMRAPEPSIRRVAAIVSQDVSMMARILQLVNSAFFGLYSRVTTPEQAIIMLGLKAIQALALSTQVFAQFSPDRVKAFEIDTLMKHSVSVGAYARAIGRSERQPQAVIDSALTAGLLHDVGKLVLADNLPDKYAQAWEITAQGEVTICDAEREIFGISHAEIGGYLLALWGLPEQIVEAVTYHHTPVKSGWGGLDTVTLVHVADAIEHCSRPGVGSDLLAHIDTEYLALAGCADKVSGWYSGCAGV